MIVTSKEIIDELMQVYPLEAACSWDHTGFQVGRSDRKVNKLLVALDPSEQVVDKAIEIGADMIITHHPLLFQSIYSVTDQDPKGRILLKLISNDISLLSLHTNYDIIRMSRIADEKLNLHDVVPLDEEGLGSLGLLESEVSLKDLAGLVKTSYKIPDVRLFGNPLDQVKRIAVCPGSGKSLINEAADKCADVLITGDIDHHSGLNALEMGVSIIDAGHYGMEYVFSQDIAEFIKSRFDGIEINIDDFRWPYSLM